MQNKKVGAGQVRLGNDISSSICGTISFLEKPDVQCNMGHWSFSYR